MYEEKTDDKNEKRVNTTIVGTKSLSFSIATAITRRRPWRL